MMNLVIDTRGLFAYVQEHEDYFDYTEIARALISINHGEFTWDVPYSEYVVPDWDGGDNVAISADGVEWVHFRCEDLATLNSEIDRLAGILKKVHRTMLNSQAKAQATLIHDYSEEIYPRPVYVVLGYLNAMVRVLASAKAEDQFPKDHFRVKRVSTFSEGCDVPGQLINRTAVIMVESNGNWQKLEAPFEQYVNENHPAGAYVNLHGHWTFIVKDKVPALLEGLMQCYYSEEFGCEELRDAS